MNYGSTKYLINKRKLRVDIKLKVTCGGNNAILSGKTINSNLKCNLHLNELRSSFFSSH